MIGKEWVRETVTVVAKTYPEYSQKYGSLVCTAGINSQGQWRRLYPIPWALFFADYSRLNFKKWDVISVPTRKKTRDRRHESYEVDPYNIHQELQVLDHLPPWEARVRFLEPYLDPDLETLWNTDRSLGVIKPKSITDFIQKERHDVTEPGEVLTMQQLLLPDVEPELIARSRNEPTHLPWLGYKFFCNGRNCHGHEMMCIDWEIQELYRNQGFDKTREKARWMTTRNMYFVVGTTWRYPAWMIIGLVYPPKLPKASQLSLL